MIDYVIVDVLSDRPPQGVFGVLVHLKWLPPERVAASTRPIVSTSGLWNMRADQSSQSSLMQNMWWSSPMAPASPLHASIEVVVAVFLQFQCPSY